MKGIILYGPPASGKDTITSALSEIEPRCALFQRLKAGNGKSHTYRMVTEERIRELSKHGQIAWSNRRYGSLYAVDTPELMDALSSGIPVIHLGQVAAIPAVKSATPLADWVVVALQCSRSHAKTRLEARSPGEIEVRLSVFDRTPRLADADLVIDTGRVRPDQAAHLILKLV
jgi:guanylate kinase